MQKTRDIAMEEIENKSFYLEQFSQRFKKHKTCPVNATLDVLGGKWKLRIIILIAYGVNRFGQMLRHTPGCSKRMLTSNLRELEKDGIINRKVFAEVPPKVIYSLTEVGETLFPVLNAMSEWGLKHVLDSKEENQIEE